MVANWLHSHELKFRRYSGGVAGVVVLFVFLLQSLGVFEIPLVSRLEGIAYDARIRLTMPNTISPAIVIADIDEKSLAREGRWPWGRDKMAMLMDQLFDNYQVAAAGFDVVFAEPDDNSGLKMLQQLEQSQLKNVQACGDALGKLNPMFDRDKLFASKLRDRPVVLGYYFNTNTDEARTSGLLPRPLFSKNEFNGVDNTFMNATGYGANLNELQASALNGGHFNFMADYDGILRRVPMLIKYHDGYYQSLSLGLMRAVLGVDRVIPIIPQGGSYAVVDKLEVGGLKIPVGKNFSTLVPYRGKQGSFRYIPVADILHGDARLEDLAGKIVLVGASAPGLMDLRVTPAGNVYPGVEIHANLLAGIMEQNIKHEPVYARTIEILTLLISGLSLLFFLPRLSPTKALLFTAFAVLLIAGGNLAAWQYGTVVLPLAPPVIMILSVFMVVMMLRLFFETQAKHQIASLFSQYVPAELVKEMSKDPTRFSMKGESREMTVLFSDISDFTRISEKLSSEELSDMINEYLTPMTRIIHKHHGTVDKYIGDAIMAFWGAPMPDSGHAQHAVEAAMEMQEVLPQINTGFKKKNWPELSIGIGINTGVMSVGNMGSQFRRAYTVVGDAVNLSSRLENLSKQYGVEMFVGENTKNAVKGIVFQEIDRVKVKGRDKAVTIYRPLGFEGKIEQSILDEAGKFDEALKFYRICDWNQAESVLTELKKIRTSSTLYQLYLDRIGFFRKNPRETGWDGVFELMEK